VIKRQDKISPKEGICIGMGEGPRPKLLRTYYCPKAKFNVKVYASVTPDWAKDDHNHFIGVRSRFKKNPGPGSFRGSFYLRALRELNAW